MKNKDKFRIYFTWNEQLYEKWIDIDYPPEIINNSEHKQAYIFKEIVPKGMEILKSWYKEITGEDYPKNYNTPLREIVINKNMEPKEVLKLINKKYGPSTN